MGDLFSVLFSNLPAVLCLIIGYGLVVVEICIPGFGVPGALGIILILAGAIIGTASLVNALIVLGVVIVLVLIALPICLRFIGKGRFSKSKLVLNDVSVPGEAAGHAYDKYLNMEGVAATPLRPSGTGLFGGERLNVVSDGAFIEENAKLTVTQVEGNRIVVAEVK